MKVRCWQHPLCGLSLLTQKEVKSGENPEQVVWDKRGGVKESWLLLHDDTGTGQELQGTNRHIYLCVSLVCNFAKAECSVHVLGGKIMLIIFSQRAVREMVSGRGTECKSEKWEPSFLVEDEDKLVRRVAFEKGFEGQEGQKWALNVRRRAQHA